MKNYEGSLIKKKIMNHFAINTAIFQFLFQIKMFSFDCMGVSMVSQQVCFDGFRGVVFLNQPNTILAGLKDQLKPAKTNQLVLV